MADCLAPGEWERVEAVVDKALEAIAAQAGPNGEFGTGPESHPASTAMAIMAFLSRGHIPGRGVHGQLLEQGVDNVLATQDDSGILGSRADRRSTAYMHGIAGLMLGEVYGLARQGQSLRIREAIVKALAVTRKAQATPKRHAGAKGGIRYFYDFADADLSVTGWHFMFYRSAKNAEFDVPDLWVTEMLQYVYACHSESGGFSYQQGGQASFAMSAVGLLCMTMTGKYDHPLALAAAQLLLRHDLKSVSGHRIYGLYYASLAMAQMGGKWWREFYPKLVEAQLADSRDDTGLWPRSEMTTVLETAFRILSLTPPCQLLPIFQR